MFQSVWPVITKYHRVGGLNNKHLFPSVLEAEKSKIKAPADPMSGESLLPGLQMAVFSLYPLKAESREASSLVSLHIRALMPYEGSTLMTYSPPKGPISKYYHIGD